jgi:hypothetical protein
MNIKHLFLSLPHLKRWIAYVPKIIIVAIMTFGSVIQPGIAHAQAGGPPRTVNIPFFNGPIDWSHSAIFWFGKFELGLPGKNYADVRVGYTQDAFEVQLTIVDYYLWYAENANSSTDLTQYDAVAIYLDTQNDRLTAPEKDDFRFLIGARHWQDMANYIRQARGNGSGWDASWVPSAAWDGTSGMAWACNPGPNSNQCGTDYGWGAVFSIPWQSIGLSGPPAEGTNWGLGVQLYDRDEPQPAATLPTEYWPETFSENNPSTWGDVHFGYLKYQSLPADNLGTTTIRALSPNDNTVEDAWMGGGGVCGGGQMDQTNGNHGNDTALYVGTETNVSNFPCFNKSFFRFSLNSVPPGKVIVSAKMILHQWGNAEPSLAQASWVSLFKIDDPWDEMQIDWNNAPLAQENVSATLMNAIGGSGFAGWPGNAYEWDASIPVAEAYATGQPVNLAIYGSDTEQHSSKYLTSSETGDWNAEGRPTLVITWGDPQSATVQLQSSPATGKNGDEVNFTIKIQGTGQNLHLVDQIPDGMSAPYNYSSTMQYTSNQLLWNGAPAAGETITLNYSVKITASNPSVLKNIVQLKDDAGNMVSQATMNFLVDPKRTNLPLVISNSSH